jgi:hypothetical protein
MNFPTTADAANAIRRIVQEEAAKLGIEPNVEIAEKRKRSNEFMVSLKRDDQLFRIRFTWVRDECLGPFEYGSGSGYIQTEWKLHLEPENLDTGNPPYCWRLEALDENLAKTFRPRILEADWLRREIRKKLAIPHDS